MQTVSKQQSLIQHNFLSKCQNHTDKSSKVLSWYKYFQRKAKLEVLTLFLSRDNTALRENCF